MDDELPLRSAPVPVRVVPVIRRRVTHPMRLEGRFHAARRVLLKAPGSGRVEGFDLRVGDGVDAGSALGSIGLAAVRQRVLASRATIHQLEAALAEREDALGLARGRGEPSERLASFERKVVMARSKLAQERLNAERHTQAETLSVVRAPFDARVVQVMATSGGILMSGQPLCELAAVDPLVLAVPAPTELAARCRPGREVEVETAAGVRVGTLARWSPTAEDMVRTLEIDVPNPEGTFAAGEPAVARLDPGPRDVLVVPRDATRVDDDGATRLLVVEHGQVRLRPVREVGGDADVAEVAGRVRAGQLVVLHAEGPLEDRNSVVLRGDH
jgi:RND family efflux transporter MFP subunit